MPKEMSANERTKEKVSPFERCEPVTMSTRVDEKVKYARSDKTHAEKMHILK